MTLSTSQPAGPSSSASTSGLSVRDAILRGDGRLAGAEVIDGHAHIGPWFNFRDCQDKSGSGGSMA